MKLWKTLFLVFPILLLSACGSPTPTAEPTSIQESTPQSTVSGSFTAGVLDVLSSDTVPFEAGTSMAAVVAEFQSYPFTIPVDEEIGRQLEPGKTYVFTIRPWTVSIDKEVLEAKALSSLVWEVPGFQITDCRLAEEEELGLESLSLTIADGCAS